MKAKALKILLFFFFTAHFYAQELLPFVENFTKSDYNGDNQNWNIAQGNDNAIYFANNHYFLRYNGVKWEKYTLPNNTVIRSIFIDGDKVYSGSYKEFGYWQRISGKMVYRSLSQNKNLFNGNSDNEEIWKVFKWNGKIYFQSFNEIFIYSDHIEKVRFPFQISYCYVVNNEIYVASVRKGIYVMRGKKFIEKENWSAAENQIIHNIEKYKEKIFVFSRTSGVFVEEDNKLIPWNHPLNESLKNEIIVSAKFVNDHTLAIGTGLQGLYLIDMRNNSFKNINRANATKNNAVLSIAIDRENDLWLGLDNGIAHVEINSPISIFSDYSGILGSVYALAPMKNGYLFASNHGVFTYDEKHLLPIPGSQGQAWDIFWENGKYIIGHNDGTFITEAGKFQKINNISGGWKFFRSDYDGTYFQANYSGIVCYPNKNDFATTKVLAKLTKPIRNIAQNRKGELWAADNYRGLYRILYDGNFDTKKVENISVMNGIKNDFGVKILSYKNTIFFLIDKIWYTYNSVTGKLQKDALFDRSFRDISDIIPIDDESFMVLKEGLLYEIKQNGTEFTWKMIPEKYYAGKLIIDNTRAFRFGDSFYMNLDDGFIAIKTQRLESQDPKMHIEGFYNGRIISDATAIEYNQPVEIDIQIGSFGFSDREFFYQLNDGNEFYRIKKGTVLLNNLESGNQKFKVFRFDGKEYVAVAAYSFHVKNPWYFSVYMVLLYVFLLTVIFLLYYKWNKFRYSQKLKLKEEELRHRSQIREIELKAGNDLQIQEYEKHILELEIQSKSSEVAGKTLSIAKQSEMIEKIKVILEAEEDITKIKRDIRKAIKINDLNKNQWEAFEATLNQINNEFVISLLKAFPNLTSKDIRLCVYLRMNMSSKEIAPLLNITFRGVELQRYRLRRKLGLGEKENINKFLLTFNG